LYHDIVHIAILHIANSGSVRPSICHTCEPLLNGSLYRNAYFIERSV